MKTISVIIATYNAAEHLSECIESVLFQKTDQIELLIIDGKSTDRTPEILSKYKDCIDLIISEKDKGIYDAWNKGIAKSRGKWIMFLGADDTLMPGGFNVYLQELEKLEDINIDYICAKNNYIDIDKNSIKVIGNPFVWNRFQRKMNIAHVGSLHARKLFETVGNYSLDYKICSDYELLLRKNDKLNIYFIDYVVAQMRTGGMSLSVLALKESYQIRKRYSSLCFLENETLFLYQLLLLYRFKLKQKMIRCCNRR